MVSAHWTAPLMTPVMLGQYWREVRKHVYAPADFHSTAATNGAFIFGKLFTLFLQMEILGSCQGCSNLVSFYQKLQQSMEAMYKPLTCYLRQELYMMTQKNFFKNENRTRTKHSPHLRSVLLSAECHSIFILLTLFWSSLIWEFIRKVFSQNCKGWWWILQILSKTKIQEETLNAFLGWEYICV